MPPNLWTDSDVMYPRLSVQNVCIGMVSLIYDMYFKMYLHAPNLSEFLFYCFKVELNCSQFSDL